jgi:hypothetical protein
MGVYMCSCRFECACLVGAYDAYTHMHTCDKLPPNGFLLANTWCYPPLLLYGRSENSCYVWVLICRLPESRNVHTKKDRVRCGSKIKSSNPGGNLGYTDMQMLCDT